MKRLRNGLPIERFLLKVEMSMEGCWFWRGDVLANGYGYFWPGRRPMYAHRFAYIAFVADIPDDYTIDHLCRNTICVRPSHLEAVTPAVNSQRGLSQVHPVVVAAANRFCRRGHWMDTATTYNDVRGYARCRQCNAERNRTGRPRGRPRSDNFIGHPPLAGSSPPALSASGERRVGPHQPVALSEAK